jgi:hypothetical protein
LNESVLVDGFRDGEGCSNKETEKGSTWTLKAPAAAVEASVAEATVAKTAIRLNHKGPGYHANVTVKILMFNVSCNSH